MVNIQTGNRTLALTDEIRGHPCWHYSDESNELTVKLQPLLTEWLDCNVVLSPTGRFATAISPSTIAHDSSFFLIDLSDGAVTTLAKAPNPSVAAFDPIWSPTGDLLLWLAPINHFATNENSHYALWAAWVDQKQPFLVAEQVELWRTLQLITDDKR